MSYFVFFKRPEKKAMLLFESGCRIHTTDFEWPKSLQPSGFSMKVRLMGINGQSLTESFFSLSSVAETLTVTSACVRSTIRCG